MTQIREVSNNRNVQHRPENPAQLGSKGYGTQSVLSSMGRTIGFGIFHYLTLFCLNTFSFISSRLKKNTPGTETQLLLNYLRQLQKDPFALQGKITKWLKNETFTIESFINLIDDKVFQIVASKELREFARKVEEVDFDGWNSEAVAAMSESWKRTKTSSKQAIEIHFLYNQRKEMLNEVRKLWSPALCYILEKVDDNAKGETFGEYLGNLANRQGLQSLRGQETFEAFSEKIEEVLNHLLKTQEYKKYPDITRLLDAAYKILADEDQKLILFQMVTWLLDQFDPSPKKRRSL